MTSLSIFMDFHWLGLGQWTFNSWVEQLVNQKLVASGYFSHSHYLYMAHIIEIDDVPSCKPPFLQGIFQPAILVITR